MLSTLLSNYYQCTREVPWSNQHVGLRRNESKPTREEQDSRREPSNSMTRQSTGGLWLETKFSELPTCMMCLSVQSRISSYFHFGSKQSEWQARRVHDERCSRAEQLTICSNIPTEIMYIFTHCRVRATGGDIQPSTEELL